MQRRYRRGMKKRLILPKNIRIWSATAILVFGILSVFPQEYLCGLLVRGIVGREPDIVDYAVHIQTPKLSLAQRLIFPQLFCYASQTLALQEGQTLAASGSVAADAGAQTGEAETDAGAQSGEDDAGAGAQSGEGGTGTGAQSGADDAGARAQTGNAEAEAGAETGNAATGAGNGGEMSEDSLESGGSLRLVVDTRAQAELLQENIYDSGAQNGSQTGGDQTVSDQVGLNQFGSGQTGSGQAGSDQSGEGQTGSQAEQAASGLTVFDEIAGQGTTRNFFPVQQKYYNLSDFDSFEALIEEFYVVDASTQPTASLINLTSLTSYDCTISKEDAAPQILIYHSHSQETYADSDENDPSTTIVGVGEYLAGLLESYGYSVLHHEGTYDVPSRDDAYSNALPSIEALLEEYPSIEVVIDLHRDAVAEGTKLLYTYEGKNYARFMFFSGISRTANGPIAYLYNENLGANLTFSFQAQVVAESYFPGITRGIYLKAWRYNMHLMPKYMLIELGAQTNTVEEAMNTCEILAFVLDQVLSGGE
ncbi:MAG: stage II sporulation protein P [Lachnospiraceae bacterium]|nr:stage II sporulation protein P [Lachnospiraceae bacterium]